MSTARHVDSTSVDEIVDGIFRISTPVPPSLVPGGFTFNQYLIRDDACLHARLGLARRRRSAAAKPRHSARAGDGRALIAISL